MPKLAIIGYCQTVALLDGLGAWRKSLHEYSLRESKSQSQKWEEINTRGQLLDIDTHQEFAAFRGSKYCLLNLQSHPIDAETIDRFVSQAANFDAVISLINGSELNVAGALDDFDIAPYDENRADSPPIDSVYIDRWVQGSVFYVEAGLTYMRGLMPEIKLVHVAPPPPVEKTPGKRFLHPSLRRKIHDRTLNRMREVTSFLEVHFLEERPEAVNEDGFIRPEFDDGDGRGNKAFGRLTAQKLLEIFRTR